MAALTNPRRVDGPARVFGPPHREIWQSLQARLRNSGLWLPDDSVRTIMWRQRSRGRVLQDQLLLECLDPDEVELVAVGEIFGLVPSRWNRRMPLVLSFGYEIGKGLRAIAHDNAWPSSDFASLCALLNLGVSLFDRQCDSAPGRSVSLAQVFDSNLLKKLTEDRQACAQVRAYAQKVDTPNLRILLKIIAEIFSRLHASGAAVGSEPWSELAKLLMAAYLAQTSDPDRTAAERIVDAQMKSTGPFLLMSAALELSCGARDEMESARQLTSQIAIAFWLIDDLVDLEDDARTNALNWILLKAEDGSCKAGIPEAMNLAALRVAAALDNVAQLLSSSNDANARTFLHVLLAYARSWLRQ